MSLSTLRKQDDESHETPDLQDLLTYLCRLVEWETFGGLMGVPSHVLGSIKAENSTIQSRVMHLLDHLVKNVKDLSWKRVIEALEKIPKEKHLAKTFPQYQTLLDVDQARVVSLKEKEGFGQSLDHITMQFTSLVFKIEKALREEANFDDVLSFVSILCQVSEPQPQNIRELFNRLQPHYSFMSYKTLQVIVSEFVMKIMREDMEKYDQELTEWLKSTTVQEFKEAVENAASEAVDPLSDQCPVVLRLEGQWLDITLHNLKKLLEYLFKKKSSILTRLRIEDGSVLVQLLAPQSEIVSLLALASRKHHEMVFLGVLSIQVGPLSFSAAHITVTAFTFEASLGAAICEKCNKALIQFLLDIGTDPDGDDPVRTPLILAAMFNNTEALSLLIKYHADIHMFNREHYSAIHVAAYGGNKEVVELLLKAGVSPDHHDPYSKFTPLMAAAVSNQDDIVYLLLQKGADKDAQDDISYSSLMFACQNGNVQSALLLLEAGANPNTKTIANLSSNIIGGRTALYIACEAVGQMPYNQEMEELVKSLLMKYNADPNIALDDGRMPLMTACYYRQHKAVNLLLQSGAYVNKQTDTTHGKNTVLLIASQQNDTALVSLLLKSNANVNVQDTNGCTPLCWACYHGNDEMIQRLLKARADPKICTNNKMSPLLLYIASFDLRKSSTVAALLKAGADPNIPDIRSPLHAACLYNHKAMVSILLKAKAKFNVLDCLGNTPLCIAACTSHEEAIKQLLEAGADAELENNSDGWTPIFNAVASGHLEIVKLLIQHGANIKRNRYGQTPLDLAAQLGYIEILNTLSQATQTPSQAVVKAKRQIKKSVLAADQTKDDKSKQVTKAKNPLNEDDLQSPYDLMGSYNNLLSTFSPGNEQLRENKMKQTFGLQALEATKTRPKIAFASI